MSGSPTIGKAIRLNEGIKEVETKYLDLFKRINRKLDINIMRLKNDYIVYREQLKGIE